MTPHLAGTLEPPIGSSIEHVTTSINDRDGQRNETLRKRSPESLATVLVTRSAPCHGPMPPATKTTQRNPPDCPQRRPVDFPAQYARTRRFSLGAPRTITVAGRGRFVYFLRATQGDDPLLCLWALDPVTGSETLLADPRNLLGDATTELPTAERTRRERARESGAGIVDFSTSADGTAIAFALNGELFLHRDGVTQALEATVGVFDPRVDPTGTAVAYVADDALHLIELDESGTDAAPTRVLASDPDPLISWGKAEFVAAEEMDRARGFWWSPDGAQLMIARVDNSSVDAWWIADPANPQNPPQEIRYPAAGTANAAVELWLFDRAGERRAIDWSDGGAFEYLNQVVWVADHAPLIVRATRDQRTMSIAAVDSATGALTEVRRITDDIWVEGFPGSPAWFGEHLLTIEDRYDLVDASGGRRALCVDGVPLDTPGAQIRSIIGTTSAGHIVVSAWTEPTEVHVGAIDIGPAGLGNSAVTDPTISWITTDVGVHGGALAGDVLAITSASPDTPGSVVSVRTVTETSRDLFLQTFVETPCITPRPQWHGSGSELRSALFMPSDHDGVSKLPVLLDPYGGPHAQRVLKSHNAHLVSQWFADQGFAVLVTDGRGTPGRGPVFERAVFGDLAQPVLDDQLEALDRVAAAVGLLDLARVGIRGWSFGGYLAALAVLRRPDRVHAAVAGAPVTTWHLYDTHYTERYLGHPGVNPEHYDRTDLILEASALSRPLLLVHGLADDNVVAAHTLRFSSALLARGRVHSVLPLSGVTHMNSQVATAANLLLMELEFLTAALSNTALSNTALSNTAPSNTAPSNTAPSNTALSSTAE